MTPLLDTCQLFKKKSRSVFITLQLPFCDVVNKNMQFLTSCYYKFTSVLTHLSVTCLSTFCSLLQHELFNFDLTHNTINLLREVFFKCL